VRATESAKRREEAEKNGVLLSRASRAISRASRRLPASGLSMNRRFPAAKTARACSRWGRPSTLMIRTASTFRQSASIESTISTPNFSWSWRVKLSTRVRLASTSGLPPLKPQTTRAPGT
jgi:hypothetical protein